MSDEEKAGSTPFSAEERLEIIRLNIGKSYSQLAKLCKCSLTTVTRDLRKWREGGGFEEFLYDEFHRLHEIVSEEDPSTSYKTVAALLGKHITRKIEAGVTLDFGDKFTALMKNTFGVEREEPDEA